MSAKYLNAVLENESFGTATKKMIMVVIADHADNDGRSRVTVDEIARKSCLTYDGAHKNLKKLRNEGWFDVKLEKPRDGNEYILDIKKLKGGIK